MHEADGAQVEELRTIEEPGLKPFISCPANMLGYFCAIRLALTCAVILSGVTRAFAFPALCAGA